RECAEGMTLLWLPNRSPKLNPMEPLWGEGKDVVSANKQYATIEEQVDRFVAYLLGLSNREALHLAGVLSPGFWLRRTLSKNFDYPLLARPQKMPPPSSRPVWPPRPKIGAPPPAAPRPAVGGPGPPPTPQAAPKARHKAAGSAAPAGPPSRWRADWAQKRRL